MNRARPQVMLEVQNTFGNALYCDIKNKIVLSDYDLADVAAEMKAMIQEKTPITLSFKKKQEAWSYVNLVFIVIRRRFCLPCRMMWRFQFMNWTE